MTNPGLAIDLSARAAIDPTDMGWPGGRAGTFGNEPPVLWPRVSGRDGARLDPSDPFWRGIFFRHLALTTVVPKPVQEELAKFKALANLYDTINKRLRLDYGWKDEAGTTWKAGFADLPDPEGWKDVIQFRLLRFDTTGAAGRVVSSEGGLRVVLPKITDDAGKPLVLDGSFSLNLMEGIAPDRIEIVPGTPDAVSTQSIPGFRKVALTRFGTDFRSVQIGLQITPARPCQRPCRS